MYGGGRKGIMGVVSDAVLEAGGTLTGILPYAMMAAGGEQSKTAEESVDDSNADSQEAETKKGTVSILCSKFAKF